MTLGNLIHALVRSFVLFGQEPSLLWTPARRPSAGPVGTGHHRTLCCLPGIISLIIMCALPGPWLELNLEPTAHSALHVTLYCTWRPSGLATGLHGQG